VRTLTLGIGNEGDSLAALIPESKRYRSTYIIGKPGKGKSALLAHAILQDVKKPYATIVFDTGDLIPDVYEQLPDEVLPRVRLFTIQAPIPHNPIVRAKDKGEQLADLFDIINIVVGQSSSTRELTERQRRALQIVFDGTTPTFLEITQYLVDHKAAVAKAMNMAGEDFDKIVFDSLADRLNEFLMEERRRRVLCLPAELDFDEVLDKGQILLVWLSGVSPATIRFIGSLLFQSLSSTILEREQKNKRKDCALYIDEFADFIRFAKGAENFMRMFRNGRKYLAALTVAHTDFKGVDDKLLGTIHSVVGTCIAFSCGASEAQKLHHVFLDRYPVSTIAAQPDYEAIGLIDNELIRFATLPPKKPKREFDYTRVDPRPVPPNPLAAFVKATSQEATEDLENYRRKRKA